MERNRGHADQEQRAVQQSSKGRAQPKRGNGKTSCDFHGTSPLWPRSSACTHSLGLAMKLETKLCMLAANPKSGPGNVVASSRQDRRRNQTTIHVVRTSMLIVCPRLHGATAPCKTQCCHAAAADVRGAPAKVNRPETRATPGSMSYALRIACNRAASAHCLKSKGAPWRRPVSRTGCPARQPCLRLRRNAQHLPRIDLVRMRQHRLVISKIAMYLLALPYWVLAIADSVSPRLTV